MIFSVDEHFRVPSLNEPRPVVETLFLEHLLRQILEID